MTIADERVLRVTTDRARADEWSLVLASAGLEARLEWSLRGYAVVVDDADAARGRALLDAYDAENRPAPAPPPPPEYGSTRVAVAAAVLLAAGFVLTGPREDGAVWFERGAADAARLGAGEWWRSVTALTLHADFPHILANAATLCIFGSSLCGLVGPGVGLWLMLIAGSGGNLITAAVHGARHSAVGASTAIFGGIGALAGIQLVWRRRGARVSAWRVWAPVAAGLGLLAFLGTAPQSDVLAHLFGFALGAVLGAALVLVRPRPLGRGGQWALVAAAALAVLACWLRALR